LPSSVAVACTLAIIGRLATPFHTHCFSSHSRFLSPPGKVPSCSQLNPSRTPVSPCAAARLPFDHQPARWSSTLASLCPRHSSSLGRYSSLHRTHNPYHTHTPILARALGLALHQLCASPHPNHLSSESLTHTSPSPLSKS
jgi:hypothetical protein